MKKEEKYTLDEFFDKIQRGEILIPVPIITGMHGAKYKRVPSQYQSNTGDKWCHKMFHLYNIEFPVVSLVTKDGTSWDHFAQFLKGARIALSDKELQAYIDSLPYGAIRYYNPFNLGTKRAFIKDVYLNSFNFSTDGVSFSKEEILLSKTQNVRCFSDEELRTRINLLFDVVKISCENIFFDGLNDD